MNTVSAEILWADLKTKTNPDEFIDCLLKGMTIGEIRCFANETITSEISSEKINKGLPFRIHSLVEKEIQWTSFQHYQHQLSGLYAALLADLLKKEETSPHSRYVALKEMEYKLKTGLLTYDVNSRINFSTDFYFHIIRPDSVPSGIVVGYNQLALSEEAFHYLNDIFKVRHELISDLLLTTEQAIINQEAEKQKLQRFKLHQTKGAMLLSEFLVALTDDKEGLLKLDIKEKHALAKQLFDLFGVSYKKWPEYDVLSRDNPSRSLDALCDILSRKRFAGNSSTKKN